MNQLYKNVSVPEFKLSSDDAEAIIVGKHSTTKQCMLLIFFAITSDIISYS